MAVPSTTSAITQGMKNRYRDAYFVSKTIVGFGNTIKVIGVVLGGVIVVGVLFLFSQTRGAEAMMVEGIVVGAIVGLLLYLLGVLVAAQGQVLQATLDTAVNSSPFLTDVDRAEVMSLTTQGLPFSSPISVEAQNRPITPPSHGEAVVASEAQETTRPAVVIPDGYEGLKLSVREAAQAIGVTVGTLQGYVQSGRLNANPDDETINAADLLRSGFIVRNLPPRRA